MNSTTPSGKADPVIFTNAGTASLLILCTGLVVLTVFRALPQIDQFFSNLFFVEEICVGATEAKRCGGFPLADDEKWAVIRQVGLKLPVIFISAIGLYLAWLMTFVREKNLSDVQPAIVAVVAMLIGPVLITNLILKEYWGRPRPFTNVSFGGEFPYVAPGDISSLCSTNCSFVSGEASSAFWMLVVILFFKSSARLRLAVVLGIVALAISFLRVSFGRHYFSDIVMSGFVATFAIFAAVWFVQTPLMDRGLNAWIRFSNTHTLVKR